MRTIGIGLASQPDRDAPRGPEVIGVRHPACDDELVALVAEHSPVQVGIDSPFGWPVAFMEAVSVWDADGRWPDDVPDLQTTSRSNASAGGSSRCIRRARA